MAEFFSQNSNFFVLGSCKPNPYFVDSLGFNCREYAKNEWCTSTGGYGEGWLKDDNGTFGTFEDFAKHGETCTVCPECGCKGN